MSLIDHDKRESWDPRTGDPLPLDSSPWGHSFHSDGKTGPSFQRNKMEHLERNGAEQGLEQKDEI